MYTCSSTFNCRETCPNGTKFIKNYILIPWSSDWDLVEEKSCPKLTKAQTEKTLSDNKGDFAWRLHLVFNHLKLLLESFPAHQFCTSWQHQQMKNLLETCPEIYSCQHQDQLQANLKEPATTGYQSKNVSLKKCVFFYVERTNQDCPQRHFQEIRGNDIS